MKTIEEIVKDVYFQSRVKITWEKIFIERINRPAPKPGYSYRRDWFDIIPSNRLNVKYFLDNILDIWYKRSSLNSQTRMVIKYVCDIAYLETREYYDKPIIINNYDTTNTSNRDK